MKRHAGALRRLEALLEKRRRANTKVVRTWLDLVAVANGAVTGEVDLGVFAELAEKSVIDFVF